ncbi:inositol phosphorylceramide synthase [Micromonospora musae]|uniref:Inositol phosphorylceramide synthase n=1 Tax=Micromonospora musae TaxID=1894970 RepID=A0ABX9RC55_9ACTN|nr:phosphatase PAP2 family protein [Micromonospora musae]RKN21082.1 inositol phosphorylceramide synthase [Micromonospora musae]
MGADDRGKRPHPLRELLLVAALFLAYKICRLFVVGDLSTAYDNATHVWALERTLALPDEATLQQGVLPHDGLVRAANRYYASVHFPATGALLLFTYLFRPALYRWARTLLAVLTAVGFAIQALVPMAPPRLLSATGVLDTGQLVGPRAYGDPATDTLSNQYAAMPSLHVGWATVVAIVLIAAGRSRWRWLWLLHPLLTLSIVVLTGNHYWLDAVAALALLGVIVLVVPRPRTALARATTPAATRAGPVPVPAAVPVAGTRLAPDGYWPTSPVRQAGRWQSRDDLVVGVRAADRAAPTVDLPALAELVRRTGPRRLDLRQGDLERGIVVAGDHEHRQYLG